jgi:hypothetical protein
VQYADGAIVLPEAGGVRLGYGEFRALGVEFKCECLMWDETSGRCVAIGLRSLQHGTHRLTFAAAVDVDYSPLTGEGTIYAQGAQPPKENCGFQLHPWSPIGDESWKTNNTHRASFRKNSDGRQKVGDEA